MNINVCLSCDDNYAKYAGVVIASVLANADNRDYYSFYILDDEISDSSKNEIYTLNSIKDCHIEFVTINKADFDSYRKVKSHNYISLATYYRLKLSTLLPNVDKVVYLDCDLVVNSDLKALFNEDLGENIFAGVKDIGARTTKNNPKYVNAGVLVMDLKKVREQNIEDKFLAWTEENIDSILLGDQDIINTVLKGKIKLVSDVWNVQSDCLTTCSCYTNKPKIIHFIGKKKPWIEKCCSMHREYYFKYLSLTPWAIEDKVYVQKQIKRSKSLLTQIKNKPLRFLSVAFYKAVYYCYIKYDCHKKVFNSKWFSYKVFANLTSWIFPTKLDRTHFKMWCEMLDFRKKIPAIKENYKTVIKNIKNSDKKINVLFLVNENSKWKTQSLYDLMVQSDKFEPIVALTIADFQRKLSSEQQQDVLTRNEEFFNSREMNTVCAYDVKNQKALDLKEFDPQIVFYQQPWGISEIQRAEYVSNFALTCYVPYFVQNYGDVATECCQELHQTLFKYYILNQDWEDMYKPELQFAAGELKGLGHTMLDYFYLNQDYVGTENYVIYAPHFSINNFENYATFLKNGKEILEYAKAHPEIKWVFKPHPTLKYRLILTKSMTEEEVDNYYKEWEKIGIYSNDGNYAKLFLESKALITDCGSFLVEYFCTKKPVIHLISSTCKIIPKIPLKRIINTYYKATNLDEMYEHFENILEKDNDYLYETRIKALNDSGLLNNYAAKNIMEDLEETLGVKA